MTHDDNSLTFDVIDAIHFASFTNHVSHATVKGWGVGVHVAFTCCEHVSMSVVLFTMVASGGFTYNKLNLR